MILGPRLQTLYLLAAPSAGPLWPPPFPGQSRGPASCYLIFSAIPFAQLYLTRSTPPRRSLGHRILHIATRSCLPALPWEQSLRGVVGVCVEKPGLRIFAISGPGRREDDSASVTRPPCQGLVGILPCEREGRRGRSIRSREGFSAGKHAIHFLFMHDPKHLNDLEHLLERCTPKCSRFCVDAGIPCPLYSEIHALRN